MQAEPEHLFIGNLTGLGYLILPLDESRHCLQVLRLKPGQKVGVIDGKGLLGVGSLTAGEGGLAHVMIESLLPDWGEPPVQTGLMLALPKDRDRLEWLVEKSVELGLTHLCLAQSQRTERGSVNAERLQRIALAALKQCRRSRLPEVVGPLAFQAALQYVAERHPGAQLWLAQAQAPVPWHPPTPPHDQAVWVAVGPEGDFTPHELAQAQDQGWQWVNLGATRLRTETAALHMLSLRKGAYGC